MSKFTPGPWVLDESEHITGILSTKTKVPIQIALVHQPSRATSAHAMYSELAKQTHRANAALISQAPDLLEMVKRLYTQTQGGQVVSHEEVLTLLDRAEGRLKPS